MNLSADIQQFLAPYFREFQPKVALVLGSGLGYLVEEVQNPTVIPTSTIPGYPVSTVSGHAGNLVLGMLEGENVLFFQGRIHYYEGYSLTEVVTPVLVAHFAGCRRLILTNSAGGLNPHFSPGDLMLITDHINLMFANPLIGPVAPDEIRFPDMSEPYDSDWIKEAEKIALELHIPIRKGTYVGVTGPNYETRSEVKFLQKIGGDAVGMSTVPENIVAVQKGMKVLGISCISNLAAGLSSAPLSHEEVKQTAENMKEIFGALIKAIIGRIHD